MEKNDWIKDAFKQVVSHDKKAEAEAYGKVASEKNEIIMLSSSIFAGIDEMDKIAKFTLENGLEDHFSRFCLALTMCFFSEGYKAGREAQP